MSRFYNYNPEDADKLIMKLDAELLNLEAERHMLEAVIPFEYSGAVFNRRYETQLHKHLGDVFGRVKLDTPNYRDEDNYNKVSAYMHDKGTDYEGRKKYSVKVTYTGARVGYDHDTKTSRIEDAHGQAWEVYTAYSPADVTEQAQARYEHIKEQAQALIEAKGRVADLIEQHNALREQVAKFNDQVPYILSEDLRLK